MHTMTATHRISHRSRKLMNPLKWVMQARATHRQRLLLKDLDAHLLEDIGVDAATAHHEAQRPFWDLPR